MKNSPKNFYNVVDKKKLGIDEAVAVAGEVEQLQTTVGDSSSGLVKQVNDLQTTVDNIDYDISMKADIDGTYPDMTVGNADQLNSTQMITDKVPYVFRTSGGSNDIGNREHDELVGGSIAWNQLVTNGNFANADNWNKIRCTLSASDNVGTLTTTDTSNPYIEQRFNYEANHVYLITADLKNGNEGSAGLVAVYDNESSTKAVSAVGTSWGTISFIIKPSVTDVENKGRLRIRLIDTTNVGATCDIKNIMLIDLTQMFGSSVADQIYILEQAQSGSGVALFRKLFPKDYYAYNAGQLMSVKTSAHEMVGFNAYDHATGTAKLLGGNEYQITGTYTAIAYEDINGNAETITPDASGIFTPTNNGTMTVTGGNDTDTCIHLTWTGYRNGEFEPYIKRSYSLDDDLELRGVAKVDGNGNIYYDGDTYESDGTVTRRYGIVDLGSFTWYLGSQGYWYCQPSNALSGSANWICPPYYLKPDSVGWVNMTDYMAAFGGEQFRIKNSNFDGYTGAQVKAALEGITLIYELATPTTESADPFQDPQWVDDFGTEEYVDTRAIPVPVGHITQYPANLRDKLQHLPSPTGVDGDYIIREDTEVMTLVPAPTGVPELPSVDGTYVLTCTVSDGTATLSWTSNS